MKKIILMSICLTLLTSICQVQYATAGVRKELEKVDLRFILDEPNINVIFMYDSLTVNDVLEENYRLKKMDE